MTRTYLAPLSGDAADDAYAISAGTGQKIAPLMNYKRFSSVQSWQVPAGVTELRVRAIGGGGGGGGGGNSGTGAGGSGGAGGPSQVELWW